MLEHIKCSPHNLCASPTIVVKFIFHVCSCIFQYGLISCYELKKPFLTLHSPKWNVLQCPDVLCIHNTLSKWLFWWCLLMLTRKCDDSVLMWDCVASLTRHSATKGIVIAMICTFFDAFNVPVFWPILVMYFIMLFCITMKRQIKVKKTDWHIHYMHCVHWQCGCTGVTAV